MLITDNKHVNEDYQLQVIVLAAGASRRFNGIKLLAEIDAVNESRSQRDDIQGHKAQTSQAHKAQPLSLLQYVLKKISTSLQALAINKDNLYIATGCYHQQIAAHIAEQYALCYCDQAQHGMGHTIAQAVTKVLADSDGTTHIMITLADQIAVSVDDYRQLITQSLTQPAQLVCAKAGQEIMSPAIFPRQYFADLMSLTGDKGAKALLYQHKQQLQQVDIANAALDIDTKQQLLAWYQQRKRG